jgi:transcriptional regulator with XRE-family HTH domain
MVTLQRSSSLLNVTINYMPETSVTRYPQKSVQKKNQVGMMNTDGKAEVAAAQLKKGIGERIAAIRKGAGLTAQQVADRIKMKRESLTQIEIGRNNPTATILWKLACVLHCEVSDFFPPVPEGFALTKYDMRRIEKASEPKAAAWAADIFGEIQK